MLNWAENGVVVPADVIHTRSRFNRRSGSKTPPGYDGTNNINLSRRSSINRNSLRDKKKKRGSMQGIKVGNKRTTPAPLMIPPVTPSVVLSQNSPTGMSPIPGTPPAARPKILFTKNRRNPFAYPGSSWGRNKQQVKRRSIGANSINILVDFNAASSSGSSENNNNNLNINTNNIINQENKDTFEKSAIENIFSDSKIIKGKSTIDEQLMVIESSKSKTILASPPPTPPPSSNNNNNNNYNNNRTNTSTMSKQEHLELQKVDVSPQKISEETLVSSDDGDESEYVDAASTFTSNPRSRTASPSPSTSTSSSPNVSPVIKPDGTIINPPAFPSPPPRQSIQISISPSINLSQSQTSPVSPPLSPTECDSDIPPRRKKNNNRQASFPIRSDVLQTSTGRGKQSEEKAIPIEKPTTPTRSKINNYLISTPPESPRSSSPTPSLPHLSKPFNKLLHTRSHSLPSAAPSSLNYVNEDNMEDNHHNSNTNGIKNNGIDIPINSRRGEKSETNFRRDSSPSPPNMSLNVSQMMFLQNNGLRRGSPLIPANIRNSRNNNFNGRQNIPNGRQNIPKPAMIMEEEEEEE
ncbi:hypothetical protein C1645_195231 [Glomus cerebriforme]|uniref:Uncharacterized protein n=1 Tax=Glomus cerebriforme TaxID=658196 RepID=A0A397TSY3_9GLOM|nr:hypothetical protein C1645_195231 [Glomus cerebriforme]